MFPLSELIEMVVYSSVTGSLNIFSAQRMGQIFFRDGQPYHAVCDSNVGLSAVVALFEETEAYFSFIDAHIEETTTIFSDPFDLIEGASRLAVRWKRVRRYVEDLDLVPCAVGPLEQARSRVSLEHWSILTSIDGQRSVADIIHELNFESIEVCEALAEMRSDHLIELRHPQIGSSMPANQAAASLVAPQLPRLHRGTSSQPEQRQSGVLKRLMTKAADREQTSAQPKPAKPVPIATKPSPPTHVSPFSDGEPSPVDEDPILRLLRS